MRSRCPIARLAAQLESTGQLSAASRATLEREVATEIDEALRFGEAAAYPAPSELLNDVA